MEPVAISSSPSTRCALSVLLPSHAATVEQEPATGPASPLGVRTRRQLARSKTRIMRVLHIGSEAANARPRTCSSMRAGPRCQQADKNRVSQVTDSRIAARHANGSWPFQTGQQMGGAPPPGHHGRAEGRYMPKAGKTSPSARDYHCIQARARTDEFGQYRYVCTRMNRSQIFL